MLEHWEALPHDHSSETFLIDCLTALSLIIYVAPCFDDRERDTMVLKYEHGLNSIILKNQQVGGKVISKDSVSMLLRLQHVQVIATSVLLTQINFISRPSGLLNWIEGR